MRFRSPLLVAGLAALALAGCGEENRSLIPQKNADELTELVGQAGDAAAAGECDRAQRAARAAEAELAGLPRRTDKRLKRNLRDWLEHLDATIAKECEAEPESTATPTATETATPEETETPEPTPTPSAEPTVTVDPGTGGGEAPPEEPSATGGVPPGDA